MSDSVQGSPARSVDLSRLAFAILAACIVAYGFFAAWLVTAGPTDPVAHTALFLSFLVSPWMLATYVVTLAFLGFGVWRLRRQPSSPSERPIGQVLRRRLIQFALVIAATTLALVSIGYLYLRDLEVTSYTERSANQQAVARLKAQQIGKWLFETMVDAEIMGASLARMPIDRLPGDRDGAQVVGLVFAQALATTQEQTAISLLAPNGTVLVHEGEGQGPDAATTKAIQALVANPSAPRVVDLHNNPGDPPTPRMAVIVPVAAARGAAPVGWLAISLDPFRSLLNKFGEWPTPSATSEVMLVHRDGEDVLFITSPLHLSPSPPPNTYRLPITTPGLLAAQVLIDGPGIRSATDYRGVKVFSASAPVNGLPWLVAAKVDEADYSGPVRSVARRVALVISAGILLSIICLWVLYRGEKATLQNLSRLAEARQDALTQQFDALTRLARDIFLMIDKDGRVAEANEAAIAAFGYPRSELIGMSSLSLRTSEDREAFEGQWQSSKDPNGTLYEAVYRRKDGTVFPAEVSLRAVEIEGQFYRQAFIRDISQRRALERRVARLSQVRTALLAANSALLRAGDEGEMYERLCGILVRDAGYRMVAVAAPVDDADQSVRYLAIAGIDDGYLAQANISWGDVPRGQGPLGTALRTGIIQVNQDFISNPRAALWRDEALKRGYRSSIALPLKDGERSFAVLIVYAAQHDAFDEDEVILLRSLAGDLAFAVLAARQRRAA